MTQQDPTGRTEAQWEEHADDNGSYRAITVARPPRAFQWYADDAGCSTEVALAGAEKLGCPLGAPPPPPRARWGHLLP